MMKHATVANMPFHTVSAARTAMQAHVAQRSTARACGTMQHRKRMWHNAALQAHVAQRSTAL
jgi:hypothetical protein